MNRKLLGYFLIALMLLSCLGACENAKANANIVTIVDGKGQSVNVSAPVEKKSLSVLARQRSYVLWAVVTRSLGAILTHIFQIL